MNLALFDLDNTLLAGDSDFEWAQFLIGVGVVDGEVHAARNRLFCMGLIANGVYLPPHHAAATCFAHTDADIDYVLEVSEKVMSTMRE